MPVSGARVIAVQESPMGMNSWRIRQKDRKVFSVRRPVPVMRPASSVQEMVREKVSLAQAVPVQFQQEVPEQVVLKMLLPRAVAQLKPVGTKRAKQLSVLRRTNSKKVNLKKANSRRANSAEAGTSVR